MRQRSGILLVDKPAGCTSFDVVACVRKRLGVQKVGHAGTLDPLATGLLVILVGKEYTTRSLSFSNDDKGYRATIRFGMATDSGDSDGKPIAESSEIPDSEAVLEKIALFQGWQEQLPPMFSAKKVNGKKLCSLARQGIEVERKPSRVRMAIEYIDYSPPDLTLYVDCSKGTYIRTLAADLGNALGCYGHLTALKRCRSGSFRVEESLDGALLRSGGIPPEELLNLLRTFPNDSHPT